MNLKQLISRINAEETIGFANEFYEKSNGIRYHEYAEIIDFLKNKLKAKKMICHSEG